MSFFENIRDKRSHDLIRLYPDDDRHHRNLCIKE